MEKKLPKSLLTCKELLAISHSVQYQRSLKLYVLCNLLEQETSFVQEVLKCATANQYEIYVVFGVIMKFVLPGEVVVPGDLCIDQFIGLLTKCMVAFKAQYN